MDSLPVYKGTHKDALAEAQRRAKYLLTFLHSPGHPASDHFKANILVQDPAVQQLKKDFIVWMGDVSTQDGYKLSWDLGATTFPFIAVHFKKTSYLQLQGSFGLGDLLHNLQVCRTNTEGVRAEEITWVSDRESRDTMRRIQEQELMEAEQQDAAKKRIADEIAASAAEERRLAAEAEEAARDEQRRAREEAEELERLREEEKALALSALPDEEELLDGVPADQIASIVLVSLNGVSHERRWPYSAPVDYLYQYAVAQDEYDGKSFYLAGGFPPKRLPKGEDGGKIGDNRLLIPRSKITMREELVQ